MSRDRPLSPDETTSNPLVHPPEPPAPERRRYCAPRVVYRQPLEAVAAICAGPGRKTVGVCVVSSS